MNIRNLQEKINELKNDSCNLNNFINKLMKAQEIIDRIKYEGIDKFKIDIDFGLDKRIKFHECIDTDLLMDIVLPTIRKCLRKQSERLVNDYEIILKKNNKYIDDIMNDFLEV